MTLQYNISNGQLDRPMGPTRASAWIFRGAIAGALALHGLALRGLMVLAMSQSMTIEEPAIEIFIDPGTPAVATATETQSSSAPAAPPGVAAAPPPQPDLRDAVAPPDPMEALAPPDFTPQQPPPPEHELRDAVPPPEPVEALAVPNFKLPPPPPKVEQPKPAPPQKKVEPKPVTRTATPAPSASQGAPSQSAAPSNTAPSAPSAAPPTAASAVAPGWNALIAAWLAAHRRYPEASRRRGEEGEVAVRFTVAGDGRVSDVALVKGSGWGALDAAALSMLQGATVPAPGVETTRTVRIRFRLSD